MAAATSPEIRRFPRPLPNEIALDILTRSLSSPVCGLALLCPEWRLCGQPNPALEAILRNTRVDTYTLPLDPPTTTEPHGTISTTFDHTTCDDDLLLSLMLDPREAYDIPTTTSSTNPKDNQWLPGDPRQAYAEDTTTTTTNEHAHREGGSLPRELQQSLVQRWISSSAIVASQRSAPRRLNPAWRNLSEEALRSLMLLREDAAVRLLPYWSDIDFAGLTKKEAELRKEEGGHCRGGGLRAANWTEKDVLPFSAERDDYLFRRIRHLVVRSVPSLIKVKVNDVVDEKVGPLEQMDLPQCFLWRALERERTEYLCVRWNKLERLESLFLDLRGYSVVREGYSGDKIRESALPDIARELHGKRLKLLVIAGLRSWDRYPGFDPATMQDVTMGEKARNMWSWTSCAGEANMFKTFRGAVRPGGKLVFVDTAWKEWM